MKVMSSGELLSITLVMEIMLQPLSGAVQGKKYKDDCLKKHKQIFPLIYDIRSCVSAKRLGDMAIITSAINEQVDA